MVSIIAVIPARMGSTRFPGKPLASILGMPMIEHVYKRTAMCKGLDEVIVATCDNEIREVVEGFGGRVQMTSASHERASDRVAETAESSDAEIVVMIQGDEPLITPDSIARAVEPIQNDPSISCVNLFRKISRADEFLDPNTIKVVMDRNGDALYFSRSPIPAINTTDSYPGNAFKQVCVIPFRSAFLCLFTALTPTVLEKRESIDMLRALEHGFRVRMVETHDDSHAVDTPQDLIRVEAMMRNDALAPHYISGELLR